MDIRKNILGKFLNIRQHAYFIISSFNVRDQECDGRHFRRASPASDFFPGQVQRRAYFQLIIHSGPEQVIIRPESVPITPQKVLLVSFAKKNAILVCHVKIYLVYQDVIVRSREKCKPKKDIDYLSESNKISTICCLFHRMS